MNTKQIALCVTLAAFVSGAAAQPTIDPGKLQPVDPALKQDVQKQSLTEGQKKALKEAAKPRLKVRGGSLSLYAVPFDTWCSNTKDTGTTGRATLVYDWLGESNTTTLDVDFHVRTAAGRILTQRKRVYGGRAGSELISDPPLSFARNEICPTGCVEARIAPVTPADANRLDQRWVRVCQAR
jgi:hypothetical protein